LRSSENSELRVEEDLCELFFYRGRTTDRRVLGISDLLEIELQNIQRRE